MTRVTIQDISREAGVSIATVSRVLNHKGNVSRQAEGKVMNAARRLNYALPGREPIARTNNRLITVIVPRLSNPFYNDILNGIQEVAAQHRYNTIVAQPKSEYGYDGAPPAFLSRSMVDGLITLQHAGNISSLIKAVDPELPIVQCCEYDDTLPHPYVAIDDYAAAHGAVSYLASMGRKRIALLNSTTRSLYGRNREAGYKDATASLGLPTEERLIYHLNIIDYNVAFSAALKLLSGDDRPDAIFAVSDVYAIAAVRAARRLNLQVPRDVAVIGFDNIDFSLMCEPPLTTVSQPRFEIGSTACTTLFGLIKKRPPMSTGLLLESELIVRGTT